MKFISKLFKKSSWINKNALTEFESVIFAAIIRQWYSNVAYISMALQLRDWLAVAEVCKGHGMPDWFKRNFKKNRINITVGRIIGGDLTLPRSAGCQKFVIPFWRSGTSNDGIIQILLEGGIKSFTILGIGIDEYLKPSDVEFKNIIIEDDRKVWEKQKVPAQWLCPIHEAIIQMLSSNSLRVIKNVVLPVRPEACRVTLEGVEVSGSYGSCIAVRKWYSYK